MKRLHKFAISNIAWENTHTEEVFNIMNEHQITGLEIAPTKVFSNLSLVDDGEVINYRKICLDHEINIIAMQSLLFGFPELTIFDSVEQREALKKHLSLILHIGNLLGVESVVFGSPKNRIVPTHMSLHEAEEIARVFFWDIGEISQKYGIYFCIEANPPFYGGNFIINAQEAISLVRSVQHPYFKFHLDTGALFLSGEDPITVIKQGFQYLQHCHISEKGLMPVPNNTNQQHAVIALALRETGYTGWLSIEMRSDEANETNIRNVTAALTFVKQVYGK